MADTRRTKQLALIEACKKADIEVSARENSPTSSELILIDEKGRKYSVNENMEIKPFFSYDIAKLSPEMARVLATSRYPARPVSYAARIARRRTSAWAKSTKSTAVLEKMKG